MNSKGPFKSPKQVLVFNGAYVLIAIVRSLHSASELSGTNLQAISFSCTGKYVATGGYYFRHCGAADVPSSDVGKLKLQDFDRLCGVTRRYYSIRTMAHKRTCFTAKRKEIRALLRQQSLNQQSHDQ